MGEYLIVGYPHGMNGRTCEFCKVTAGSKEDAIKIVSKSIWYSYHALDFIQSEYDDYTNRNDYREITVK